MNSLYIDMDGVVADFDRYAHQKLGVGPSEGKYPHARSRCDDIVLWNKHTERQILNGKITVLWNGNPGGS